MKIKLLAFFKAIRPINLLILFATLFICCRYLLYPICQLEGWDGSFSTGKFFGYVLAITFIMIAGYLINDLFDRIADKINRDDNLHITDHYSRTIIRIMAIGFGLGAGICCLIVNTPMGFNLVALTALIALIGYSSFAQRVQVLGNVIVAALCALIPVMPILAAGLPFGLILSGKVHPLAMFALFAFLLTLIREWVKDMQDRRGDEAAGYRTMAVAQDIQTNHLVIAFVSFVSSVIIGVMVLRFLMSGDPVSGIYLFTLILIPLCYLVVFIHKSKAPRDYRKLGILVKMIMVAGLIYGPIYSYIYL